MIKMTNTLRVLAGAALLATVASPALAAAEKQTGEEIVLPAPPEGQGQIVFYRNGGMGMAIGCSVNENGEKVSSLGVGRYFVMNTTPGRHEFTVKSEAKDVLALEVEDGERQFAKCKIKMGIMVGRPDLRPSDENEFRASKGLKLVDDDDMGPAPGAVRGADMPGGVASSADEGEEASSGDE